MPGKRISHGRGGAGNISVDTDEYVDGLKYSPPRLTQARHPHYSTGIGGAGNIRKFNADEIAAVGRANAIVGACPTTERNLGDGILPADELMRAGVRIAFGSDSLTLIDPLENARELEYNLRLQKLERAVLDTIDDSGLPQRLFDCATRNGAASVGAPGGSLETGSVADFFTVDLDDLSIAGTPPDELLASILFGLSKTAIREVAVNGRFVVEAGRHPMQEGIVSDYNALMRKAEASA